MRIPGSAAPAACTVRARGALRVPHIVPMGRPQWKRADAVVDSVRPRGRGLRGYFAVGIANSAPLAVLSAQRCITDFCFV